MHKDGTCELCGKAGLMYALGEFLETDAWGDVTGATVCALGFKPGGCRTEKNAIELADMIRAARAKKSRQETTPLEAFTAPKDCTIPRLLCVEAKDGSRLSPAEPIRINVGARVELVRYCHSDFNEYFWRCNGYYVHEDELGRIRNALIDLRDGGPEKQDLVKTVEKFRIPADKRDPYAECHKADAIPNVQMQTALGKLVDAVEFTGGAVCGGRYVTTSSGTWGSYATLKEYATAMRSLLTELDGLLKRIE